MNRRSFLKVFASAAAALGLPLPEISVPTATVAAPVVETLTPIGKWAVPQTWTSGELLTSDAVYKQFIAGERIPAGSMVYIGDDGLGYRTGAKPHGVALDSAEPQETVTALVNGSITVGIPTPEGYYMSSVSDD